MDNAGASPTLKLRRQNSFGAVQLVKQGVPPLLAKLYASRGIRSASDIYAGPDDLLPTVDLKNCTAMASMLADCIENRTRVLIVSDYDCDGATACSVLVSAFEAAGMNFGYLVPDRMVHGYGLTPSIVDEAAALNEKPQIIITVDNGISSVAGVERARELGIEVLVTDHHLAPETLPNAKLIVNPNQQGCDFASKDIAGCGVAWYVALALSNELAKREAQKNFNAYDLLPYVAIGTIADVVKLDKNNKILVREGLERIRAGVCSIGIQALVKVAKKNRAYLTCSDIGFGVGPRINAAGRLSHMSGGIECLTTNNLSTAIGLAESLNAINEERKEIQKEMVESAVEQALSSAAHDEGKYSIVVFGETWHEGVVGVVAGRIKEDRHRPTIVMCQAQDGDIKGSGRSIPGFHLKHALDKINAQHPGVLVKFGGHAMAAGMTIHADKLEEFKLAFEAVCKEEITPDMLEKTIEHDGPLPAGALSVEAIRTISMEVWGQGFPEPVFAEELEVVSEVLMGKQKEHLKIGVRKEGVDLPLLAFGHAAHAGALPKKLSTVFRPQINEFAGKQSIQLLGEHFGFSPVAPTIEPVDPQPQDVSPPSVRRSLFRTK